MRDEFEGNLISANGYGIYFGSAYKNWIAGNLIGTDISGTVALPNSIGAHLAVNSAQNVIGTNGDGISDQLERNIISGNDRNAIELNSASENLVAGNWIGLGIDESIVANGHSGVWIHNNSVQNVIGGRTAAQRNTISGNAFAGVAIASDNNQVHGNYIGTSPDGLSPAGNKRQNIYLYSGASGNFIGGPGAEWRNIIAAAGIDGIFLDDAILTTIVGNWIGLGADGETLLGNDRDGIGIHGGTVLVTIGGRAPGEGNLIADNRRHGIGALWMWDSFVTGNKIGETTTGAPAPNAGSGIRLDSSIGVFVGDGTKNGANSITSIGSPAVTIVGDSQNVYVQRNEIRTNTIPVDLAEDGPSPNDPSDFDLGPNRMQNYRPVLAVSNNPLYSVVTAGPIDALATPYYDYAYAVRTDEAGLSYYRFLGELENLLGNGPDAGGIYALPPLEEGERIALISYDQTNGSSEFSPPVDATLILPVSLHGGEQYDEGEMIRGEIARGNLPLDIPVSVRLSSGDPRLQPIDVTIPAGDVAAPFAIQIENDELSQATKNQVLLAAADDLGATGSAAITIRRSDSWHNDLMPFDTNGDDNVAPSDVLAIINQLNAEGAGRLPTDNATGLFVDVNADQHLSPIDALQIINFLNSALAGESEHNSPADKALSSLLREPDESLYAFWGWLEHERKHRHAQRAGEIDRMLDADVPEHSP